MTEIRDLDVVQLTADQPNGLVEGARGRVPAPPIVGRT